MLSVSKPKEGIKAHKAGNDVKPSEQQNEI